ncbi:MAG: hypothetical protein AB8F95_12305 [Bacteroidia bacterium]
MISEESWKNSVILGGNYLELDWFGIDQNGLLGVFSSAGPGYIPEQVKASRLNYIELLSEIENLPFRFKPILKTREKGIFIDWMEYAQQGLIGFDYQDVHRVVKTAKYDLISIPETLLTVDELYIRKSLINLIPRFRIDFNQPKGIDERELRNRIV